MVADATQGEGSNCPRPWAIIGDRLSQGVIACVR